MHVLVPISWNRVQGVGAVVAFSWLYEGLVKHGRDLWGPQRKLGLAVVIGAATGLFLTLLGIAMTQRW